MGISVVFADDHAVVRYGLSSLLLKESDIEVVGQAGNAVETLDLLEKLQPDVLLLDLYMPGVTGTSLIEEVRARHPHVAIVMMSGQVVGTRVRTCLQAGAVGFVRKDDPIEELIKAVRAGAAGHRYLSPALAQEAYQSWLDDDDADPAARLQSLTPRERQIICLAGQGKSNRQIACKLFISYRTVETHRFHAMQKLGLHDEIELGRFMQALEQQVPDGSDAAADSP